MKEGWEYKRLKDVATFTRGLTYSKNDEAEISNNIVLRSNNVDLSTGKLNFDELKYLRPEFSIPEEKRVKKGSLLMCMSNGSKIHLGKVALINEDYPYAFGGFMALVTPSEELNPQFFHYSLSSPEYKDFIKKLSEGANINNIKIKELELFTIPIPPLSEQQSIVDYLDSAFAKIDAMKANAEKALNEAKALFQASLKEMLEPKEGWEEKALGEVGTFIRGGNFSKKDFVEDGFPCIHYGQIHTRFGVATYEHLSCVPKTMVKAERCASKGDLVIAITSEDDEGSCKCTAWMADYDAYVGGHAAIFKHSLNPIFVSYYFKAARFQKAKLEYTHGFKVVEISPKDIAKIPICYPTETEQQSIVATLDSIKSKVDLLQENYDKISQETDALKQAILRQVFE